MNNVDEIVNEYFNNLSFKERRLKYLQIELKSKDFQKDQVVNNLIRVLTNISTIGKNTTSCSLFKLMNKNISEAAYLLFNSGISSHEFHKLTINEHSMPIKELLLKWIEIVKRGEQILVDDLWNDLTEHPVVTITKEEDAMISASKLRSRWSKDRYSKHGIKILRLEKMLK